MSKGKKLDDDTKKWLDRANDPKDKAFIREFVQSGLDDLRKRGPARNLVSPDLYEQIKKILGETEE